ncbi:hypothetical protein V6N11_026352 [Hibiscus sabdariffa]|uniref:Mitochondrial protein n=1 Tax=Hibiscus sabdariffa TaxID=183260 RepID=A0ABR2SVE5_9ROSI
MFQSSLVPVLPASRSVPHSSHLGHSAVATTSASIGSASIRVEVMGEHSNTVMHDQESPRQTGELRTNGASSESSRELSLPEHEPQQDLSLPADHSIESHEGLSVTSSNQGEPQELLIPDMHLSDDQPESSLHTNDHVHSDDTQLDLSLPIVEPEQNVSSQPPQRHVSCSNVHPMVTRRKNGIFKPKIYTAHYKKTLPSDVYAALEDPDWKIAVMAEYEALVANNTWEIVELPADRKPV